MGVHMFSFRLDSWTEEQSFYIRSKCFKEAFVTFIRFLNGNCIYDYDYIICKKIKD